MEVEVKDLPAQPGDTICWGDNKAVVQDSYWEKGSFGKRFVYVTITNEVVPLVCVNKVERKESLAQKIVEQANGQHDYSTTSNDFEVFVEHSPLPSNVKVIIHCLIKGDVKNLEIAQSLLNQQLQVLREMTLEG